MKRGLACILLLLGTVAASAQPQFQRVKHRLNYRIHPTIAEQDSFALVFGGFNGTSMERNAYLFQEEKFTPVDLQYPGPGFGDNIAFFRDSFLYVGGGIDSNIATYGTTDFWRCNWRDKKWERLRDLPFYLKRVSGQFHRADGEYVVVSELDPVEGRPRYSTTVYRYRPEGDAWELVSRHPQRYHSGGPAYMQGDDLYVLTLTYMLGNQWSGLFYRYNLTSGTWSELESFTGPQRILPFWYQQDSMLYVGGGTLPLGAVCNCDDLYGYDLNLKRWRKIDDLKFSMAHGLSWKTAGVRYVGVGRDNARDDYRSLFRVSGKP